MSEMSMCSDLGFFFWPPEITLAPSMQCTHRNFFLQYQQRPRREIVQVVGVREYVLSHVLPEILGAAQLQNAMVFRHKIKQNR
jgi:hypothetical protein